LLNWPKSCAELGADASGDSDAMKRSERHAPLLLLLFLLLVFVFGLIPALLRALSGAFHLARELACGFLCFLGSVICSPARFAHLFVGLMVAFPLSLLRRGPIARYNSTYQCTDDRHSHSISLKLDAM
jgi:hypothetical protein